MRERELRQLRQRSKGHELHQKISYRPLCDIKMKQTLCYFTTINMDLVFNHILGFVFFISVFSTVILLFLSFLLVFVLYRPLCEHKVILK